jgi:L-methionine (R)-S-oxide reductase
VEASHTAISYRDKAKFYKELHSEVTGILEKEWFVNLANVSALLKQHLPEINWVGFYLACGEELLLSSFQGLPACTRIKIGKGVCGTAAATRKTILVADVDQFPGHIVCDSASRSEVVVPLIVNDQVIAVLDVDSPHLYSVVVLDQQGLEEVVRLLIFATIWPVSF